MQKAGSGRAGFEWDRWLWPSGLGAQANSAARAGADDHAADDKTALPLDLRLDRSVDGAEKELASRFLSYTGEEVPKMQVLKIAAAKGALPPHLLVMGVHRCTPIYANWCQRGLDGFLITLKNLYSVNPYKM